MANVGFTLKLGKGSGTTYSETPQYVVQNEVKRLTVENQELKERVRNLEEKRLEIVNDNVIVDTKTGYEFGLKNLSKK